MISKILEERGKRYGEFETLASVSQNIKDEIYLLLSLDPEKKDINKVILEGLDMIIHKLARIANGDPYYVDSWRDLSAYAKLVYDKLENTDGSIDVKTRQIIRKNGKWIDISKNI